MAIVAQAFSSLDRATTTCTRLNRRRGGAFVVLKITSPQGIRYVLHHLRDGFPEGQTIVWAKGAESALTLAAINAEATHWLESLDRGELG